MNIESIDGIYRFYRQGELIGEYKNALTSAGRAIVIKSLLGTIPNFVDSISYGIDSTPNTFNSASTLITNNSMGFEIGRTEAEGSSFELSGTNDALVFYGEIVDPYQYQIREVGIYPSTNVNSIISVDGSVLFNFDEIDNFVKAGTYSSASLTVSASARIGISGLSMPGNGNSSANYIEAVTDDNYLSTIATFSSQDLFKLALFKDHSASGNVFVQFLTDSTNYYTISFTSPASAGYFILNATKGSASLTGTPTWDDINSVKMWNGSASTVLLDAIKIDVGPQTLDTTFGLISRAILPDPIFKPASIPITIQYSLLINFSGGV